MIKPELKQGLTINETFLSLKNIPSPGFAGMGKVISYYATGKLYFLYTDEKKNALFYDFTKDANRILQDTKIPKNLHQIESIGIRVGHYVWILGGQPAGSNPWNDDPSSTSTVLWSIPKKKWIHGPDIHEELRQRNHVACGLAVDFKTVMFFYPCLVFNTHGKNFLPFAQKVLYFKKLF